MPVYLLILYVCTTVALAVLFTPRVFRRPLSPSRRFWLGALQLCPLLVAVWLTGNPVYDRSHRETVKQTVVLVVDDSPSMAFEDGESGAARYERVQTWMGEATQKWKESTKSASLEPVLYSDLIPPGLSASDFGAVIDGIQRRFPKEVLAGVILASDGQDHGNQSAAQAARKLGVPIHTLGIGPLVAGEDIGARWLEVPETALPGSPFMVRWGVDSTQSGAWAGRVRVTSESREVSFKEVNLQPGEDHLEEWASIILENSGKHVLRLAVESSRTSERVAEATASVQVRQTTPTLLILESQPTRLTQSLSQTVLEGGRYRVVRAFPSPEGGGILSHLFRPGSSVPHEEPWRYERIQRVAAAEWESALGAILPEVSLVVLGRSALDRFPTGWASILEQHLQHSRCGILVLPGAEEGLERVPEGGLHSLLSWTEQRSKSFQGIEILCPPEVQNHPAMAPIWLMLNQTWKVGPDESFDGTPPYAHVLMTDTTGHPLIFESRLNLSRAVAMSLSDLWTLRSFDTSKPGSEKRFVEGLWLGLVDYLTAGAGGKSGRLHVSPNPASVGQTVQIMVEDAALQPGPAVSGTELRRVGETSWRTLPLGPDSEWAGLGRASWIPREPGSYEIRYASGEETTRLRVLACPPESADRMQNQEVLAAIATASGGRFVQFSERDSITAGMDAPPRTWVRSGQIFFRHDPWTGIFLALLFCVGWGIRRLLSLP
jgi:hypothetical protein